MLEIAFTPSFSILAKAGVPTLGTDSSEFMYLKRDLEVLVTYDMSDRCLDTSHWSASKS